MKPQTKFKKAVIKLAASFGLTVTLHESMSGYDSRTKEGWTTFRLLTDQAPADEFLTQLEELNQTVFSGVHAISGLPAKVRLAVRNMTINGVQNTFCNGVLTQVG
ncbi:hypothetical protein [Azonexus hydrophilus]|uniref:Uncharacterized protein n=1 Tax=Azonexus hydrophilus TaxID=418702 RepID=A0ABZ2XPM0_9RHOO